MLNNINDAGIALVKSFESCRLTSYQDIAGVWTIGYGHTENVAEGQTITQFQADNFLEDDLESAGIAIDNAIIVDLNDNQFSALASLVFNCGPVPLTGHIGKYINNQEFQQAADYFLQWDHAGGVVVPGLLRRREAERALFLTT